MDIAKGLSLAIQYKQQGKKSAARDVLRKILSADKYNEQAWLLFSEVAEKPEHEIQCLKNVLKINPDNTQAKLRFQEICHPRLPANNEIREEPKVPLGGASNHIFRVAISGLAILGLCFLGFIFVLY